MRKAITIILFTLAVVAIAFSVFATVMGVIEIRKEEKTLANTPGTSGSDYLGLAVVAGAFLVISWIAEITGLILSAVTAKISKIDSIATCSLVMCLLSVILVFFTPLILRLA